MNIMLNLPKLNIFLVLILILTTFVYCDVIGFEFLIFGDDSLIIQNAFVANGLSLHSLEWSWTAGFFNDSIYVDYWQPLTLLSHILTVEAFGLNPSYHHGINLLIHLLNVVLVYVMIKGLFYAAEATSDKKEIELSALCLAALFAVHPFNVEVVSLVAARADVLSVFFSLACIILYSSWRKNKKTLSFLFSVLCCYMAIMSKQTAINLPFIILAYEIFLVREDVSEYSVLRSIQFQWPFWLMTPLIIALVIFSKPYEWSSSVTFYQLMGHAIIQSTFYIVHFFVPFNLIVNTPEWIVGGDALAALISTALVLLMFSLAAKFYKFEKKSSYGWVWFVIAIGPYLFIEFPSSRGMYWPVIGLSIFVFFIIRYFTYQTNLFRRLVTVLFPCIILFFSFLTKIEAANWKNDATLNQSILAIDERNYRSHNRLGRVYENRGEMDLARYHYYRAKGLNENYPDAVYNVARMEQANGELTLARQNFEKAWLLDSTNHVILTGYANLLSRIKEFGPAEKLYQSAIQINPQYAEAQYGLGALYANQERYELAISRYEKAITSNPHHWKAHYNLANTLAKVRQSEKAIEHYQTAIEINPLNVPILYNIARVYAARGSFDIAKSYFMKVINIEPNHFSSLNNIGVLFEAEEKYIEALAMYERAIAVNNKHFLALSNAASLLWKLKRFDDAERYFEKADEANPKQSILLYNHSKMHSENGDIKKALDLAERVLLLNPNHTAIIEWISELKAANE